MDFIRFIFSFLYSRNWHTGQKELSSARVWLFVGFLFLLGLALFMIAILQRPIYYQSVTSL